MAPKWLERLGVAGKGSAVTRFSSQALKPGAKRWKGSELLWGPSVAPAVFHHCKE
jgi:hypothetical protein